MGRVGGLGRSPGRGDYAHGVVKSGGEPPLPETSPDGLGSGLPQISDGRHHHPTHSHHELVVHGPQ